MFGRDRVALRRWRGGGGSDNETAKGTECVRNKEDLEPAMGANGVRRLVVQSNTRATNGPTRVNWVADRKSNPNPCHWGGNERRRKDLRVNTFAS